MDDIHQDGGAAFPIQETDRVHHERGMTLRDWFAGQAMSGMHASVSGIYSSANIAEAAYRQADAMLVARNLSH